MTPATPSPDQHGVSRKKADHAGSNPDDGLL